MRAAVFHSPGDIRLVQVPDPRAEAGEIIVRVGAAGICGTDLRIYSSGHHRIPAGTPRILGHELAGEVVEVGGEIPGLQLGVHVGIAPNIGCGVCADCVAGWTNLCADYRALGISLDGGFAEYVRVPADAIRQGNVTSIPSDMPFARAALAEPLSCCLNGQEAVGVGRNDVVAVIGAGPIGMMHLFLARLSGARAVILSEVAEARLAQARELGADIVVDAAHEDLKHVVQEVSAGRGADVVIVAAPSARAQQEALELVAHRGRINFFGGLPKDKPFVELNSNLIHYRQALVTGTTGSNVRQYRTAMSLVVHGRIDLQGLVGATLPLDQVADGLERTRAGAEMRIMLEPGPRPA